MVPRDRLAGGYLAGAWAEMPAERNIKESLQVGLGFFFSFLGDFEGCMHAVVKRRSPPKKPLWLEYLSCRAQGSPSAADWDPQATVPPPGSPNSLFSCV